MVRDAFAELHGFHMILADHSTSKNTQLYIQSTSNKQNASKYLKMLQNASKAQTVKETHHPNPKTTKKTITKI
jgi:uncharacterized protein YpbB